MKTDVLQLFIHFFVYALVWFCLFPLPPHVWEGMCLVIVALPGVFPLPFLKSIPLNYTWTEDVGLLLPSLWKVCFNLLVQEKKRKIDIQNCPHGSHLGFLIRTSLAFFDLQVTTMLSIKFSAIGLLVQEKKRKIDFQDGGHLGFPIGTILLLLI